MVRKQHKNGRPMRRTKYNGKKYFPYYLNEVANPGSKPPKWNTSMIVRALFLGTLGLTEREISIALGVHEHTINYWKRTKPEFKKALKKGKNVYINRVEDALQESATGYSHPAVHFSSHEGFVTETPYMKHYPPNVAAISFLLKNRARDRWLEPTEQNNQYNTFNILNVDLSEFTIEELKLMESVGLKQLTQNVGNRDSK